MMLPQIKPMMGTGKQQSVKFKKILMNKGVGIILDQIKYFSIFFNYDLKQSISSSVFS